jgi:6-phosphogluconate dehydrogenase
MKKSDFGLIGLGVMGQNFVLNLERHGNTVSVFNRNTATTRAYIEGAAAGKNIVPAYTFQDFVASLAPPRRIMLLVKAGEPVDWTIQQILPFLEMGDLIIDGGNSLFSDSARRAQELEAQGYGFLGMGVSGGEEGALWGPSLMPGGSESAWRAVEPILSAVAAKAKEDAAPCVMYIGPGGAGHFVKMVHNGIEYGDMQLIAEAYDLLRRTLGCTAQEFHDIFADWNTGALSSFLIDITAKLFLTIDAESGAPLVDLILDKAGQKGTGKWTTKIAGDLGVAIPTISASVDARFLSAKKEQRMQASALLAGPAMFFDSSQKQRLIDAVRDALYASKVCSYAQGMSLLREASEEYHFDLDLAGIARIWRAGCIIRADLLNDISNAFSRDPEMDSLLLDEHFRASVDAAQTGWRYAIRTAVELGIPVPAMSGSLAYYDAYRSARLPANLVQAQRDFFGAHTFERVDKPGVFHADWSSPAE